MSYRAETILQPQTGQQHRLTPRGQRYLYSITQYFFSAEDIPKLKELVDRRTSEEGVIVDPEGEQLNAKKRSSRITWLEPAADTEWLYQRIGDILKYHNQTYYGYDLQGIEHLQFTEYGEGDFYGPHLDWGSGLVMGRDDVCRKLSFTVQLSNPDSYEGGDFNLPCDDNFAGERERVRQFGSIIVFPSWILHEVTPVTKGTRRSLVGWCLGPEFR